MGTLEGRTGYYEIDLTACDAAAVLEVLRHTGNLLAVQLPERGMTAAMLRLLTAQCGALECLRLPRQSNLDHDSLLRFLAAVEGSLQSLALGGRPEVFESPQLARLATPCIKRMRQLKYLDICDGAVGWQPTTQEVKALLEDKQLRGLNMVNCMQVDCAAVLAHPALRHVECLDMRRCTPQPGWFSSAGKRLVAALMQLDCLRVLQMPALPQWEDDARPLNRLKSWAMAQDMAFLRLGDGVVPLVLYDRDEVAALARASSLGPEERLHAFANWNPHFADIGRWCPPPRERWESMDLCKRGAVYILRELAALRSLGYPVQVLDYRLEIELTGPAYRLHWELTGGHSFCVTVRADELNLALERLPVSKVLAREGLGSVAWLTVSATRLQLGAGLGLGPGPGLGLGLSGNVG